MTKFNFDELIDRHNTHCTKFDGYGSFTSDYDEIIPMWIADMDFATPDPISDAIRKRLEHPVLGYCIPPEEYYTTLQDWFSKQYGLQISKDDVTYTPGVVAGIYKLIQCWTKEEDGVTICPPVYYPFADVIHGSRRRLVEAPLLIKDERYYIDWEALDKALAQSKILLWCHPHNPGGRVWTAEELQRVATMAKQHGCLVISDEIHADLTFSGHRHMPFPSVSDDAKEVGMSLMAPSKVFNMPGVIASQMYIPNPRLRDVVFPYMVQNGLAHASCYTYSAVIAAYKECGAWSKACMQYIEENVELVRKYITERIPRLKMIQPEASFLIFLDCRELGFRTTDELANFFVEKAGVMLNDGSTFGTGGEFFMRLNVGTPRSVLEEALKRIEKAVNAL